MIEAKIIDYLNNELSQEAYGETPETHSTEYIVVVLDDQGITDWINAWTVTLNCYSNSKANALLFGSMIRDKMLTEYIKRADVSSVKLGGFQPFIDTQTKEYYYAVTLNIFN